MPVERTLVAPPRCRMGPISAEERAEQRRRSPVGSRYDQAVDRDSAEEMLLRKAQQSAPAPAAGETPSAPPGAPRQPEAQSSGQPGLGARLGEWLWGTKRRQGAVEAMTKSVVRSAGSRLGREIMRGVLGGMRRR